MNSSPASVVGILDRLSIGVSRISIRHGHTKPKAKKPQPELTGFRVGLGEKIWVHNHIATGMIIYSHNAKLKRDSQKGLAQIPFTVKKQKPPVLREDYWTPLCLIELPKGQGVVGRSVMQKLQEFRRRHELEWGYQANKLMAMGRRERGDVIHNQKTNAIADIAAVLSGVGKGNLMWAKGPLPEATEVTAREAEAQEENEREAEKETEVGATSQGQTTTPESGDAASATPATKAESEPAAAPRKRSLVNAHIYWSNNGDLYWARKWTENVEHHLGLPAHVKNHRFQTKYIFNAPEESGSLIDEAEKAEATKEAQTEQEEAEKKRGWFSWLGGKSGSSLADARA